MLTVDFGFGIVFSDFEHFQHKPALDKQAIPLVKTAVQILDVDILLRVKMIRRGVPVEGEMIVVKEIGADSCEVFVADSCEEVDTEHGNKVVFGGGVVVFVEKIASKSIEQAIRALIRLLDQYLNLFEQYVKWFVLFLVLQLEHVKLMRDFFRQQFSSSCLELVDYHTVLLYDIYVDKLVDAFALILAHVAFRCRVRQPHQVLVLPARLEHFA